MERKPEFIGRRYQPDEKESRQDALRQWSEEASKPIEGELEKSEEEVRMIETVNAIIRGELESLGLTDYNPIPPEKVHVLPGEVFKERFPDYSEKAFFRSTSDVVFVNKDKVDTKARMFQTMLHELIHRASEAKFYADEKTGDIYDARVGYRIRSPWKGLEREDRLGGFNEMVVDFTAYRILLKNQQTLESDLGLTKEDIQGPIYTYMHYGPILESIVTKIAEDKGIPPVQVFSDLERGQFESNILVLKDVEKSFGKGSLEALSLLGTLRNEEDNEKLEVMVKDFFAERDETARQNMVVSIKEFVRKSQEKSK